MTKPCDTHSKVKKQSDMRNERSAFGGRAPGRPLRLSLALALSLSLWGCSLAAPKEDELFSPVSSQDGDAGKRDGATGISRDDGGVAPDIDGGSVADDGSDTPRDAAQLADAADAARVSFDPQVGLKLHYRFNESSGNIVNDFVGDRQAIIAGTPAGFEQWIPEGHIGGALRLSGDKPDGGVGHSVELPQGVLLGLQECSIALWVNRAGGPQWQRVFDLGSGSPVWLYFTAVGGKNLPIVAGVTTSGLFLDHIDIPEAPIGQGVLKISQSIPAATWVHFALTWSASEARVYLNGKLAAQATPVNQTKPDDLGNTAQNYLGRSQYPLDPYFNGMLDEFRIYDRVLSESDVAQLYELN